MFDSSDITIASLIVVVLISRWSQYYRSAAIAVRGGFRPSVVYFLAASVMSFSRGGIAPQTIINFEHLSNSYAVIRGTESLYTCRARTFRHFLMIILFQFKFVLSRILIVERGSRTDVAVDEYVNRRVRKTVLSEAVSRSTLSFYDSEQSANTPRVDWANFFSVTAQRSIK